MGRVNCRLLLAITKNYRAIGNISLSLQGIVIGGLFVS
jgi:hypothetical protein